MTSIQIVLNSADNSGKVFATILRLGPADLIEVMRNITLDELVKSVAIPAGALSLPPNKLSNLGINILELNSEGYFLSGQLREMISNSFTYFGNYLLTRG
jgi:hypothetical protein